MVTELIMTLKSGLENALQNVDQITHMGVL